MAIIKFASGKNTTYAGMKKAIDYILSEKKTDVMLSYGKDCDPDHAYFQFIQTKMDYHKEDGRQFKHLIQSFADYEDITPKMAHQVGKELLNHKMFEGYQVVMATHKDKDHIHNHYIINTVNLETGKKWDQSKNDLYELRSFNDDLCRKYHLIVVPANEQKQISDGEYRNTKKSTSWKHELWLLVNECMKYADSRQEFINKMNRLGYQVAWTDERKYITFTTPDGKKCRNRKLYPPENYTKENLEQTFEINRRYQKKEELTNGFELLMQAVNLLQAQQDQIGKTYPLSKLEGQALRDYIRELEKGRGLAIDEHTYEN